MLTEKDYCDYETCVALKELGFREKCPTYYDTEDNVGLLLNTQWSSDYMPCQFIDCLESHNSNTSDDNSYIDAPTIYQAQKWLREIHNIFIMVDRSFAASNSWYYVICTNDDFEHLIEQPSLENYSYEEALSEGIKQSVKILKEE